MATQPEIPHKPLTLIQSYYVAQQQTSELPALYIPEKPIVADQPSSSQTPTLTPTSKKVQTLRIVAIILVLLLILIIYLIWRPAPSTSNMTQSFANFATATTSTNTDTFGSANSSSIEVYVTGAIQHPGVYTLASGARVYQLLQAAGGPLPRANLAAINMAAHLSDGSEVYVALIGETPPVTANTNPGTNATSSISSNSAGSNSTQAVNINSATADELRQHLPISSKTAQNIVNYRVQHGPFLSVDELTQVVSKAIYTKIKDMVTV